MASCAREHTTNVKREQPSNTLRARGYARSHCLSWLAYGIAVAGLVYVIWNLHLPQLKSDLTNVTWWLVALAVILDVSPRMLESVRWRYLLRPLPIRYRHVLQAIYVGTIYSGILPLSAGEFARALMVSWRTRVSAISVFATQLVERIADAIALLFIVWLTLGGLALPRSLRIALAFLESLITLVMIASFVLFLRRKELRARVDASRPSGRAGRWFKSLALNTRASGVRINGRTLLVAISAAIVIAFVRVGVLWLLLTAYHIDLSYLQAAGLFGIITVGTFLPNAPGKLGSWQFFCALGLGLFGVSSSQAAGFSMVAYVFWTLPPILIGFGTLTASPFSWSQLRPGRRLTEVD